MNVVRGYLDDSSITLRLTGGLVFKAFVYPQILFGTFSNIVFYGAVDSRSVLLIIPAGKIIQCRTKLDFVLPAG